MKYSSMCYACGSKLANLTFYRKQKPGLAHFTDIFSLYVCVCVCVCVWVFFSFKSFLSGKYNAIHCHFNSLQPKTHWHNQHGFVATLYKKSPFSTI